jgi:hypothetical protein
MRNAKRACVGFIAALTLGAATADSAFALKSCVTQGQTLVVKGKLTVMHSEPNPKSGVLATLGKGAQVTAAASCPTQTGKMFWYLVESGAVTGWVSGGVLKL